MPYSVARSSRVGLSLLTLKTAKPQPSSARLPPAILHRSALCGGSGLWSFSFSASLSRRSRQIKLRWIDGWHKIASALRQHTPVAARRKT